MRRSAQLRCAKILFQIGELLREVHFTAHQGHHELLAQERRLLGVIEQVRSDPTSAGALHRVVRAGLSGGFDHTNATLLAAEALIEPLARRLQLDSENFAALMLLDDAPNQFSAAERHELQALLDSGHADGEANNGTAQLDYRLVRERQLAWRAVRSISGRIRGRVARQAEECYCHLLHEIEVAQAADANPAPPL